ncbi:MAG: hypothetical protein K0Q47_30 [Sedimentibacter sp.]|jgi:hypothetical protein|nr:hypothetical protein [Sedimentibacter sp.]
MTDRELGYKFMEDERVTKFLEDMGLGLETIDLDEFYRGSFDRIKEALNEKE